MTDRDDDIRNLPPVPPPVSASGNNTQARPPQPEPFMLPTQLLEQWVKIPPGQYVEARLTRGDLDQLFFGLTKAFSAQQQLQECIVRWSNGDLPGANAALDDARRKMIEGDNNIRHFFLSLMTAATTKAP